MVDTFHILKTRNQYLVMKPPRTRTMFLTFKNLKTAHKCKDYIEFHRKKYGAWPNLNMDTDYEKLIYDMDHIGTHEPLYIEEKTLGDIEEMMHCSGAGVIYCYEFGMIPMGKSFTITFRAQEMDVQLDLERYMRCLENTLDS